MARLLHAALQPVWSTGNSVGSGRLTVEKPVAASTKAEVGMPVALARNVEPSHGRVVAVRKLGPLALTPPAVGKPPPATRSPFGDERAR